jgi:hypothetical protein
MQIERQNRPVVYATKILTTPNGESEYYELNPANKTDVPAIEKACSNCILNNGDEGLQIVCIGFGHNNNGSDHSKMLTYAEKNDLDHENISLTRDPADIGPREPVVHRTFPDAQEVAPCKLVLVEIEAVKNKVPDTQPRTVYKFDIQENPNSCFPCNVENL